MEETIGYQECDSRVPPGPKKTLIIKQYAQALSHRSLEGRSDLLARSKACLALDVLTDFAFCFRSGSALIGLI